jgi:alkylation response protein AidB-like acyl-CoA dehydrogenase
MYNLDGTRIDRARLCPEHADLLKEMSFINRPPYTGGSWHHHFALGYLLADPGLYCSLIVTNQTAYAVYKYAPQQKAWLEPLLSGEAWGATWMTEIQGGSDLGANATLAKQGAGGWRLYGDEKYFASNAGLADLVLATARPEGAPSGPKGLALFLVPRLDERGELNFHVRRLKDKLGTRAVPTGEAEFNGSRAFLVGEAEKGIYYTLETLTVSRLANAVGAMGLARKAHLETAARTTRRSAFGATLGEHPLVRWDLTDMAARTAGGLCLVFHAIERFACAWRETPPYTPAYHYARFLSHLAKNRTYEHSAEVTRLAMELFGGLGFLEEYPLARLHRESLVTGIWEGASNVQALDMLEAIHKKGAGEAFAGEFIPMLEKAGTTEASQACETIEAGLEIMHGAGLVGADPARLQWYSKETLTHLADAAQVALLYALAETGGERYYRLASLYARRFLRHEPYPDWAINDKELWFPFQRS